MNVHKDLDQDALRELVECRPRLSTLELALDLNTSQFTICRHLKKIGKLSKMAVWVCLGLWHINFCRLFNAKSIFIQINRFILNNSV